MKGNYGIIMAFLREEFESDQYTRIARRLYGAGFTSEDFLQFMRSPLGRTIPDPQTNNTYAALRSLEILLK